MESPDGPSWARLPPSPPASTHVAPGNETAGIAPPMILPIVNPTDHLSMGPPAPLPTPRSMSVRPSTPRPLPAQIPAGTSTNVQSPPTPAPSPGPSLTGHLHGYDPPEPLGHPGTFESMHARLSSTVKQNALSPRIDVVPEHASFLDQFRKMDKADRAAFLANLVEELSLPEGLKVVRSISPRLRRDFLLELPIELALQVVSFIDNPADLGRASQVSRYWHRLTTDDTAWRTMCRKNRFIVRHRPDPPNLPRSLSSLSIKGSALPNDPPTMNRRIASDTPIDAADIGLTSAGSPSSFRRPSHYREEFKQAYMIDGQWLRGGRTIANFTSADSHVVSCMCVDERHIVIAMGGADHGNFAPIHIFDAVTGAFQRSLYGHNTGVWAMSLITPLHSTARPPPGSSRSQNRATTARAVGAQNTADYAVRGTLRLPSGEVCGAVRGWGSRRSIVVSGGCDRCLRVWDASDGTCLHSIDLHTSTIRCLKVLDGKPLVVTGSRDATISVVDIQQGVKVHTLLGHGAEIRCMDVVGNIMVSGSYDAILKVWNVEQGRCIHTLVGHYNKIYTVAFDGERIVSGSMDATIRLWSADTGDCLAMLSGHTALVGVMQLHGPLLLTGGSDGRILAFNLGSEECLYRICAHDNSITALQFNDRYIVSSGNDGRVKLWDRRTGRFIRDLTRPCESVWRVCFREDRCVIVGQRNHQTILEVVSFRPREQIRKRNPLPGEAVAEV